MKILQMNFSPRGPLSESRALAREILGRLLAIHPLAAVTERSFGEDPLPHIDAAYAAAQHSALAETPASGAIARSDEAIEELTQADILVIGTPMHNLSVPSSLKAWLDHVVRARRTFNVTSEGKKGMLRDRPVLIAIASGGRFSGQGARQPDFLTGYLRELLKTVGLCDVHFFSVEGTGRPAEAVALARRAAVQSLDAFFESFAGLQNS